MAEGETVVEVNQENISRGEREEVNVDLGKVENLEVLDSYGRKIRFGDIYAKKKTIFVFVREYVEDLALIPEKYLKEKDVQLVVIGCSPYKFIQPFRATTGYKFGLFVDPDRELYKALGLREKLKTGNIKDSKHVKSNFFMGVLRSTWRGMKYAEFQGDINQQGGSFIIGPGDELHFSHVDQTSTDHRPINDLLAFAGVDQVNFKNDKRVLTL